MPDLPRADDLLRTARQTLLEVLLPALPPERKYEALMIARVMAMSARELETADFVFAKQTQRLESLCGAEAAVVAGVSAAERLGLLEKRLVTDIRDGRFDDHSAQPLRSILLALTRARLGISNPKYLQEWESTRDSWQAERAR
jgi:hypothetical protein